MAKTKKQKEQEIKTLQEKLNKSKSVVFANYEGLKVKDVETLRGQCRDEGVDYLVVKKTLLKKSLEENKLEAEAVKDYNGGIAAVFGYEDEIAPAKILDKFSKDNEALQLIGGYLGTDYMPTEQVLALAKLPGKQELLAKVVGSLSAPVSGFVNVLAGNLRGLVQVLNAIRENKA